MLIVVEPFDAATILATSDSKTHSDSTWKLPVQDSFMQWRLEPDSSQAEDARGLLSVEVTTLHQSPTMKTEPLALSLAMERDAC